MIREESRKGARRAWGLGLTAFALMLAGCGGGSTSPVTSAIYLKSPDVAANGVTKPNIQCGFGPMWMTLEWGEPPDETKELAIYFGRYKYVKTGNGRNLFLTYADLFSKVKPSLRRLPANEVPDGGEWSYIGASCPAQRTGQGLVVEVLALDRTDAPRQMGRPLATRLAEEALGEPHPHEAPRSPGDLTREAVAVGRLIAFDGPPRQ
jgi:hypothetical protein